MDLSRVMAELEASMGLCLENSQKLVQLFSVLKNHVTNLHTQDNDDLTHLLRRGRFLSRLEYELHSAHCNESELHLMLIDIDHFKVVNDTYGHQAGDAVLERVSALIQSCLRPNDIAGRYGGEELIVAVQCPRTVATEIAERIRVKVSEQNFATPLSLSSTFNVTLSLGLASGAEANYDPSVLIALADRRLYAAKRSGRNRAFCEDETLAA